MTTALTVLTSLAFDFPDLGAIVDGLCASDLDELDFGVIGFDANGIVRAFNVHESRASGIRADRVIGRPLFTEVAPCMNNYMVAQRFVDAAFAGIVLDTTVDFVLTLRMKPTPVRLRLIDAPGDTLAHILVNRRLGG